MPNLLKQSEIMFNEENLIWDNSLKPLLNKLNAKTIFRVKINLTTKTHKLIEYP